MVIRYSSLWYICRYCQIIDKNLISVTEKFVRETYEKSVQSRLCKNFIKNFWTKIVRGEIEDNYRF